MLGVNWCPKCKKFFFVRHDCPHCALRIWNEQRIAEHENRMKRLRESKAVRYAKTHPERRKQARFSAPAPVVAPEVPMVDYTPTPLDFPASSDPPPEWHGGGGEGGGAGASGDWGSSDSSSSSDSGSCSSGD